MADGNDRRLRDIYALWDVLMLVHAQNLHKEGSVVSFCGLSRQHAFLHVL